MHSEDVYSGAECAEVLSFNGEEVDEGVQHDNLLLFLIWVQLLRSRHVLRECWAFCNSDLASLRRAEKLLGQSPTCLSFWDILHVLATLARNHRTTIETCFHMEELFSASNLDRHDPTNIAYRLMANSVSWRPQSASVLNPR